MVKRYDIDCESYGYGGGCRPEKEYWDEGDHVSYSDYASLESLNRELVEANEKMSYHLDQLIEHFRLDDDAAMDIWGVSITKLKEAQ